VKDIENIVKKCIKRDEKSLEKLYRYLFNDMMGICMRYQKTREDAEEILNDCFVKITTSLKKRDQNIPLIYWVKRVTVNKNIDELRKKKAMYNIDEQMHRSDDYDHFVGPSVDHLNHKIEVDNLLYKISLLQYPQQEIFNLFVIDGYSHQEIAGILDLSEASSRFHLHFARKNLKEMLKKTELRMVRVKS